MLKYVQNSDLICPAAQVLPKKEKGFNFQTMLSLLSLNLFVMFNDGRPEILKNVKMDYFSDSQEGRILPCKWKG